MWNKKVERTELSLRAPKKRKSFFEKKEKNPGSPLFSRLIFRLALLVFIGSVIYILFFSQFLEVKEVYLNGVSELNYNDVYGKITGPMEGKYFNAVPKNNLLLVSKKRIEKDLLDNFRKISSVEVEKIFPDKIRVKIIERKALLLWCSAGPCYIIDENGYAYSGADFESDEIKQNHLIRVADISAKPVIMGEKILSGDYISFVSSIKDELNKEMGLPITDEYQTQSRIASEARVKTEEGWDIYFNADLPIEGSVLSLKTFMEKEINQDQRNNLEYIDLRAENKVYYKFKDESQTNADLTPADAKTMAGKQTSTDNTQTTAETKKNTKKKKN
jgi:cell division septal protein FtsQ